MNSVLTYSIVNLIAVNLSINGWGILLLLGEWIPISTLVPRFILNLRELYAYDLQGRRGSNIDTAFGLTSASSHGLFVEDGRNEGEEIQI